MPDDISPDEEAARADVPEEFCQHAKHTGDPKWAVLCDLDNRFATNEWCQSCKKRR
jgi:hypothetical protein